MKHCTFLLGAAFLVCVIHGCKKPVSPQVTNDFTWNGLATTGTSLRFINNGAGGLYWDFGDSTTATGAYPYHIYHHAGSYTVSLTVNGNNALRIDKTINIYDDPGYTNLIGGARAWHRVYTLYRDGSQPFPVNYADTSFPVHYLNPLTIYIEGDTLSYRYSTDSVLTFIHEYYYDHNHPTGSYDVINFNHVLNTISLRRYIYMELSKHATDDYTTF